MAQLKELLVAGPARILDDLYLSSFILGNSNAVKSFGSGLSIDSNGVLSAPGPTVASGTGTSDGFTVDAVTYSTGTLRANEDTSSVVTTPSTYYLTNDILRFLGLKNNSTLSLTTRDNATYSAVLGLAPWSDSSRGPAWEMAFSGSRIYTRHGTTSWGNWSELLTSASSIDSS